MKIEVSIPPIAALLSSGVDVAVSTGGWPQKDLGIYTHHKGVYVIHHDSHVKYVGKTDGKTMTFWIRMRRHFQQSAAQNKFTFQKLLALPVPPSIKVSFLTETDLLKLVISDQVLLSDTLRIRICEQAMIAALEPEWQT